MPLATTPAEHDGLAIGREATQAHAVHRRAEHGSAYWEGWSWAVWDYEDANGLPRSARS